MIALEGLGGPGTLATAETTGLRQPAQPLCIAVINNMPDPALRVTERQICNVLAAASDGMIVDVKFYSLPGIVRSGVASRHIAECYEDFADLIQNPPDGVIVTGAEPKAGRLSEEPFWPHLSDLIAWTEEEGIPAIWSCLAAHAAVLRLDGVERRSLPRKLSGIFNCLAHSSKHQIMHRMPRKYRVPHSRWNGLDRKDLEAQGYTVLASAAGAGIDMFMKQAPVLQLFLHGHPEYEAATLLAEYRRDVLRAVAAQASAVPDLPAGMADRGLADHLSREARAIVLERRTDLLPRLDLLLRAARPAATWAPVAHTLFRNWLAYLDVSAARCAALTRPAQAAAAVQNATETLMAFTA